MKDDNGRKLLTTKEAAAILRISPRTLERKRRKGDGPRYTRLGPTNKCKVVYLESEIHSWIIAQTGTGLSGDNPDVIASTPSETDTTPKPGKVSWLRAATSSLSDRLRRSKTNPL